MQYVITSIFCYVDDFLKGLSWKDDPQCHLSPAEIITISLTASRFFAGNLEAARLFLSEHGYMPLISKSRLNRRLHSIPDFFWHFIVLYFSSKKEPDASVFLVDSFPISVCLSVRSSRRALFQGKEFIGYNASKKMWFTGLKVHVMTTALGQPREFFLTPGSIHDLTALKKMYLGALPKGSTLFGDKAYTSQDLEEELLVFRDILLSAERRINSKRGQNLLYQRYGRKIRKKIEIAFSNILRWVPRKIHAVTNQGFLLKLMMFITAFSISFLCP